MKLLEAGTWLVFIHFACIQLFSLTSGFMAGEQYSLDCSAFLTSSKVLKPAIINELISRALACIEMRWLVLFALVPLFSLFSGM